MMEKLKEKLKELLKDKSIGTIIGYGEKKTLCADGSELMNVSPVFLTEETEVDGLVWNRYCVQNLVTYLTKEGYKTSGKIAIMVKPCDFKAINVLCQENQITREQLFVIGLACNGVMSQRMGFYEGFMPDKCTTCLSDKDGAPAICPPQEVDYLLEIPPEGAALSKKNKGDLTIEEIEGMPPLHRWEFWQAQFKKCVRCYACRSACPMCYCEQCICDMSRPQWIEKSPTLKGNFLFHAARAFHLSGRCVGCSECERVCPMGLPLMLINKKMIDIVRDLYDYRSGEGNNESPLLSQFRADDDESFIK